MLTHPQRTSCSRCCKIFFNFREEFSSCFLLSYVNSSAVFPFLLSLDWYLLFWFTHCWYRIFRCTPLYFLLSIIYHISIAGRYKSALNTPKFMMLYIFCFLSVYKSAKTVEISIPDILCSYLPSEVKAISSLRSKWYVNFIYNKCWAVRKIVAEV